jgi:hypothetical protein
MALIEGASRLSKVSKKRRGRFRFLTFEFCALLDMAGGSWVIKKNPKYEVRNPKQIPSTKLKPNQSERFFRTFGF